MTWLSRPSAFLTVFNIVLLAWIVDFWAYPKTCLNSQWISSMQWEEVLVPTCSFAVLWSPRVPANPEEITRIAKPIDTVSRWLRQFSRFQDKPKLVVRLSEPLERTVQGHYLILGQSVIRAEGQLERAWIEAWALQNLSASRMANGISREVTVDILFKLYKGRFILQDPSTGRYAQDAQSSLESWVIPETVASGRSQRGFIGEGRGLVLVTPALRQKFFQWFETLSPTEKAKGVFLIVHFWKTTDWPSSLGERNPSTESLNVSTIQPDIPGWKSRINEMWSALIGYRGKG